MARSKETVIPSDEMDVSSFGISESAASLVEQEETPKKVVEEKQKPENNGELESPLRNERIIVRHIARQRGFVTNPKHVLYGGMAENASRTFSTPRLDNGLFYNVLNNKEKAYLEKVMGLEPDALSIYKKVNNFWSDANPENTSRVTLTKQDNVFDLSNRLDYIKYKILLANKDFICPSVQELQDRPKETYQFVIVRQEEEGKMGKKNMSITMQCYKEYGKIEEDKDKLRLIIETITSKKLDKRTSLDYMQTQINDIIQSNNKLFLKVVTDESLDTKVLIQKCFDAGLVANRGGYYYIRDGNVPMCESGEEPTLTSAAKWLVKPRNQEMRFSLEAKLEAALKDD